MSPKPASAAPVRSTRDKRDFADDEDVAQAIAGRTGGGVAACVAQKCGLILAGKLEGRGQAEEDAGGNRNGDGKGEHVEIERDDGFVGNRVFWGGERRRL